MDNKGIIETLISSKKYKPLNNKTISNVVIKLPDNMESVRSKLHQIWGAYYTSRPRFEKILKKVQLTQFDVLEFCKVHSSTNERVGDYVKIFDFITNNTSGNSIIDIGCGLNPLLFSVYSEKYNYLAVDIDIEQQSFLNKYFEFKVLTKFKAIVGDALIDKFERVDIAFLFKLLPVLDQIDVMECNKFISSLDCNYLVVSLPNKSLGGREKGMRENYRNIYQSRIESLGYKLKISQEFNTESVYIFNK